VCSGVPAHPPLCRRSTPVVWVSRPCRFLCCCLLPGMHALELSQVVLGLSRCPGRRLVLLFELMFELAAFRCGASRVTLSGGRPCRWRATRTRCGCLRPENRPWTKWPGRGAARTTRLCLGTVFGKWHRPVLRLCLGGASCLPPVAHRPIIFTIELPLGLTVLAVTVQQ
jgi:hypothetical protein